MGRPKGNTFLLKIIAANGNSKESVVDSNLGRSFSPLMEVLYFGAVEKHLVEDSERPVVTIKVTDLCAELGDAGLVTEGAFDVLFAFFDHSSAFQEACNASFRVFQLDEQREEHISRVLRDHRQNVMAEVDRIRGSLAKKVKLTTGVVGHDEKLRHGLLAQILNDARTQLKMSVSKLEKIRDEKSRLVRKRFAAQNRGMVATTTQRLQKSKRRMNDFGLTDVDKLVQTILLAEMLQASKFTVLLCKFASNNFHNIANHVVWSGTPARALRVYRVFATLVPPRVFLGVTPRDVFGAASAQGSHRSWKRLLGNAVDLPAAQEKFGTLTPAELAIELPSYATAGSGPNAGKDGAGANSSGRKGADLTKEKEQEQARKEKQRQRAEAEKLLQASTVLGSHRTGPGLPARGASAGILDPDATASALPAAYSSPYAKISSFSSSSVLRRSKGPTSPSGSTPLLASRMLPESPKTGGVEPFGGTFASTDKFSHIPSRYLESAAEYVASRRFAKTAETKGHKEAVLPRAFRKGGLAEGDRELMPAVEGVGGGTDDEDTVPASRAEQSGAFAGITPIVPASASLLLPDTTTASFGGAGGSRRKEAGSILQPLGALVGPAYLAAARGAGADSDLRSGTTSSSGGDSPSRAGDMSVAGGGGSSTSGLTAAEISRLARERAKEFLQESQGLELQVGQVISSIKERNEGIFGAEALASAAAAGDGGGGARAANAAQSPDAAAAAAAPGADARSPDARRRDILKAANGVLRANQSEARRQRDAADRRSPRAARAAAAAAGAAAGGGGAETAGSVHHPVNAALDDLGRELSVPHYLASIFDRAQDVVSESRLQIAPADIARRQRDFAEFRQKQRTARLRGQLHSSSGSAASPRAAPGAATTAAAADAGSADARELALYYSDRKTASELRMSPENLRRKKMELRNRMLEEEKERRRLEVEREREALFVYDSRRLLGIEDTESRSREDFDAIADERARAYEQASAQRLREEFEAREMEIKREMEETRAAQEKEAAAAQEMARQEIIALQQAQQAAQEEQERLTAERAAKEAEAAAFKERVHQQETQADLLRKALEVQDVKVKELTKRAQADEDKLLAVDRARVEQHQAMRDQAARMAALEERLAAAETRRVASEHAMAERLQALAAQSSAEKERQRAEKERLAHELARVRGEAAATSSALQQAEERRRREERDAKRQAMFRKERDEALAKDDAIKRERMENWLKEQALKKQEQETQALERRRREEEDLKRQAVFRKQRDAALAKDDAAKRDRMDKWLEEKAVRQEKEAREEADRLGKEKHVLKRQEFFRKERDEALAKEEALKRKRMEHWLKEQALKREEQKKRAQEQKIKEEEDLKRQAVFRKERDEALARDDIVKRERMNKWLSERTEKVQSKPI